VLMTPPPFRPNFGGVPVGPDRPCLVQHLPASRCKNGARSIRVAVVAVEIDRFVDKTVFGALYRYLQTGCTGIACALTDGRCHSSRPPPHCAILLLDRILPHAVQTLTA